MNFGSFGAGFGSFGSGVGGLLPSFTNITSWLKTPTTDGKTLANSKGTDANLTGINCLQFTSGGSADYVAFANDITTTTTWTNELDVNWSNFGTANSGVSFLSADDQTRWWRINGSDGNSLFIEGKMGNTQFREINISSDVSLSTGTTYRIKTVWSGSSVALYIDGVLKNTYNWGNSVESNNTFGNIGRPVATSGTAKISNWKFYHNGILEIHYPLAEGTGTKAYDVSGKGNHGVINNSTWTTANGMESWNHEYGFDVDGSVKVPALNFKSKQVATFDGSVVSGDTTYIPQGGNLVIDARIKPDSVTGQRTLYSVNGNSGFWFRISNGEWQLYSRNAYIFSTSTGIDPAVGNIYDTRIEYDYSSGDWTAKVKLSTDSTYTTVGSGNRLPPIIGGSSVILGQKGGAGFFDGQYHSFKLTEGGVTKVEYDFQNNLGTQIVQDTSGNGNNLDFAVGSGGTASFWGTRIADTSGSLVSADYAAGNTGISNPSGVVHNGSECGVDMVTNDLTSAQLFAIDNSTATQTFVRKDNGNILQILDYSSALTGDDLTRTRNYVG